MNIGEKLYVWLPPKPLQGGMGVSDLLNTVIAGPDRMEFELCTRRVVGYVCGECVLQGIPADLCRSPEWDPSDPAFKHEVPQEVMAWAQMHARDHVIAAREAERRRKHE